MQTLSKIDRLIGKHILWFVLGCLVLGVGLPDTFSVLVPVTPYLFAMMTFCNVLGCSFRQMGGVLLRPAPILTVFFLLHVAMPLLCLGLCRLLFADAPLFTTGLVLQFVLPTAVATLMWVDIGRGNLPLCLSAVLLDTLLSPIIIPFSLKVFVGSLVEMDAMGMMRDLLGMVALPAALALALHGIQGGRFARVWKARLSPFAKLSMLAIIVSNATGVAPFLRNITSTLVLVIVVLMGLSIFSYFLGYLVARHLLHLDFPSCQSMTLNTGLRNISAGAVLAAQYFPADVLFPVAFSPIFAQLSIAVAVKILRKTKAGQADQAAYDAARSEDTLL